MTVYLSWCGESHESAARKVHGEPWAHPSGRVCTWDQRIGEWLYEADGDEPDRREAVDHPPHYGGADDPYEAVKVIEAWDLPWHLGDCVKYIARHGKKDPTKTLEDLRKARWYLDRYIGRLEGPPES